MAKSAGSVDIVPRRKPPADAITNHRIHLKTAHGVLDPAEENHLAK